MWFEMCEDLEQHMELIAEELRKSEIDMQELRETRRELETLKKSLRDALPNKERGTIRALTKRSHQVTLISSHQPETSQETPTEMAS